LSVQAAHSRSMPYLWIHARGIVYVERPAQPGLAIQSTSVFCIGFIYRSNRHTHNFCPRSENPPDPHRAHYRLAFGRRPARRQLGVCYLLRPLTFTLGFSCDSSIVVTQFYFTGVSRGNAALWLIKKEIHGPPK